MCGTICTGLTNACLCCAAGKSIFSCQDTSVRARAPYMFLWVLFAAMAIVMRYLLGDWSVDLWVTDVDVCIDTCRGYQAVYRISFVLFVFFFVHALMLFTDSIVHTHYWGFKSFGMLVLTIVAFAFIPHEFYVVYAHIARFCSLIFLIIQAVLLIDFAYQWAAAWVNQGDEESPAADDEEDGEHKRLFLFACVVLLVGCLTLFAFMFEWFSIGDCPRNDFFIVFTLILGVLYTVLSITEWCEHGSLLTSLVVMSYSFFLLWSALSDDPSSCSDTAITADDGIDVLNVVLNLVVAFVAVLYAGWTGGTPRAMYGAKDEDGTGFNESDAIEMQEREIERDEDDGVREDLSNNETIVELRRRNRWFHAVMAGSAMYMAMLMTNWGFESTGSSVDTNLSEETVWIKMSSQWLTILLYVWTLSAPYLLKDRDFS